jgi:23S rRNA pseudouridine2605 synthase
VRDRVEVDGKRIVAERKSTLLLYKPRGCVATLSDPEGRPTVMELLPEDGPRIYPVGRLDFNTEGLLLFTNDGDLANGLMHPRREVEKTYHVKLRGILSQEDVARLEEGIELDGAPRKARVAGGGVGEGGKHSWVELTITEGRNRQVHRMMESLGHQIARLVRVGYGPLTTKGLRPGKWRRLEPEELRALAALAGTAPPGPRPAPAGQHKATRPSRPKPSPTRRPARARARPRR